MKQFQFNGKERHFLERLGVMAVMLFGSRALGLSRAGSDYDFGVLLKDKSVLKLPVERKKTYCGLYEMLSDKINELADIDIVFLEDAPAELQTHAAKYGVLTYEAVPGAFADFKEYVMIMEGDFEPYKKLFQQAILSRL